MSKIYDNIAENIFEKGLHAILSAGGVRRADFCVGYFNLRGWKNVADDVDKLPGDEVNEIVRTGGRERLDDVARVCRILVGMHRPPADLIRDLYQLNQSNVDADAVKRWKRRVCADFRKQLTLGVPTKVDEEALKKLREQLIAEKVSVRLHLRFPLHAKLYIAHRPGDPTPILALMGSSNLTFGGLVRNGELNAEFADVGDTTVYDKWFNGRWNDKFSIDITKELIEVLDASWIADYTPYEVYLKIMYHLSREARNGIAAYHLPAPFDKELFDFQQTAVKLAVRHLEKRGGAMIGDVVGLGKTITACAVAKYYEEVLGASTLVLCPANLVEMWKDYAKRYDLKLEARSIAKTFDVRKERFFKLVIIDESQNLRNAEGQRYARIRDLLAYQGNKVLLLTATPYNKDYSDLANQLRLFVDPEVDLGIRPEDCIKSLGGDHAFAAQYPDTPMSSLKAFEKSVSSDDWRDLMKLYLVRRTRTFIKKNYAATDPDNGRKYLAFKNGTRAYFPDRKPITLKFKTTPGDQFERLYNEQMIDWLADLKLPRYGLMKYLDETAAGEATKAEKQLLENLSRAGKRLMGFIRSGFYKRMDSSGIAFLISLYRHAVRNAMYLYALKNGLDLPIHTNAEIDGGYEEEADGDGELKYVFPTDEKAYQEAGKAAYEAQLAEANASVKWLPAKFLKKSFATDIRKDNKILLQMLSACNEWKSAEDEKLNMLHKLLVKKHQEEKVLVFTQYSDTARYLAAQLKARGVDRVAMVDGDTDDVVVQTKLFSPVSNRAEPPLPAAEQTRVLVATDMLSEGQNLQDAHIVVNFDLPWAIIRLIQRAGRVDRIDQKAEEVYCYSFFPQEGVNEIIHLRDRLNDRLNANAQVIGADEIFFEGNEKNLTDLFNEKAGILDEQDDGEVDLSSQAYQVWETATKDNPALAEKIKNLADVIYSTKPEGGNGKGVITYARTKSDNDVLVWTDEGGKVKSTSPVKIFQALASSAATPTLAPLANHHDLVKVALGSIKTGGPAAAMGVLGSRTSVKYRIFALIENRLRENLMPLFEQNLKAISDELYNYPMKESAKNVLGKMLQQKRPADAVLETVQDLHKDGELCLVPDEEDGDAHEPRIVCSMGLNKE